MKTVLDRADSRGHANHGWLDTYHTFSFANYYNPERMGFGVLRVLNDDTVAPGRGFDTHPHQNMEIVSIPLEGRLEHGDSIRNRKVIGPGEVQVMSAGTGLYHSEMNASNTESVSFLQIWVLPRTQNRPPAYADFDLRGALKPGGLYLFLAPDGSAPAAIDQDAWFSMGTVGAGEAVRYKLHRRQTGLYLFVVEGEAEAAGVALGRRDGMGFYDTESVEISVTKESHLLLMEVPVLE